jgi:hypothetical protein
MSLLLLVSLLLLDFLLLLLVPDIGGVSAIADVPAIAGIHACFCIIRFMLLASLLLQASLALLVFLIEISILWVSMCTLCGDLHCAKILIFYLVYFPLFMEVGTKYIYHCATSSKYSQPRLNTISSPSIH